MMQRCYRPARKDFHRYGGRGILVDERWHVFSAFLADMGERPRGLTIERIDNHLGYQPGNCKWGTWTEQQFNRRCVKLDENTVRNAVARQRAGESNASIARSLGVHRSTISKVVSGGAWKHIVLAAAISACSHGGVPQAQQPPPPPSVQRAPCLRHPKPPSPDPTTLSSDPDKLEAALWARIEQLEMYADQAWAECGDPGARAPSTSASTPR